MRGFKAIPVMNVLNHRKKKLRGRFVGSHAAQVVFLSLAERKAPGLTYKGPPPKTCTENLKVYTFWI